jgi:hypothetical protein
MDRLTVNLPDEEHGEIGESVSTLKTEVWIVEPVM